MVRKKRSRSTSMYIRRHRRDADTPYAVGGATIGIFAVISIVLFGASWFQSILLSSNNFAAVVSAVLVDLANADRDSAGVGTLTVNEKLVAAAQAKANDMAQKGYFAHTSPDGREPWNFVSSTGYEYEHAGENLAIQFSDSLEVERAWLASPTHRANLLDTRFAEIGIATAYGTYQGRSTTFVVQMFGTPKAEAVQYIELPHEAAPQTVAVTSDVSESAVLGAASATGADTTLSPTTHKADPPAQAHTNFANQNLGGQAGALAHVAASPQTYFEYAITLLVVLALALGAYVWFYEMKQGHYRHDVYIVALSLALIALLYAADAYVFTDPVLASTLMIYST